jgi:hypothetical protein
VFVLSLHTLTSINQDIGRHITIGEIIIDTWSIPDTNLFSYTAPDYPFMNHHWLGEVFLYVGSAILGLKWLIVLKAVLLTITFGLAVFAFYRKNSVVISAIVSISSMFILIERTDVRPEIFSFLYLAWFLFVLFRKPNSKLVWTLPFVQILWVNTHIYFILGPAIYMLFFVGRLIGNKFDFSCLNPKNIWPWAATVIAIFINPFFWRGALYPLYILRNYGYSIVENKSPFFLQAFGYPQLTTYALFVGITIVVISFVVNYRNITRNIFGVGLVIMGAGLALYMVRNFPVFAIIMIPVAVKNFYEAKINFEKKELYFAVIALLFALIISAFQNQIYPQAKMGRNFGLHVPYGAQNAVAFVRENKLEGPIFNNFDIGSFLIWKLPEEKVFIDGRPEAYPTDFIQEVYIPMQEDQDVWEKYSEEYGIKYIFWNYRDITPWSVKFVKRIQKDKNWPIIYNDGTMAILVKNTPEHRELINKYSDF